MVSVGDRTREGYLINSFIFTFLLVSLYKAHLSPEHLDRISQTKEKEQTDLTARAAYGLKGGPNSSIKGLKRQLHLMLLPDRLVYTLYKAV